MSNIIDMLIIGAGPAGLACASNLLIRGEKIVLVLEKGNDYLNRKCFVDEGRICKNCKPACNVISGFGGCIHYGDSAKLSKYPSGKALYELLGNCRYNDYLSNVKKYISDNKDVQFIESKVDDNLGFDIKNYGISIWNSTDIKAFVQKQFLDLSKNGNVCLNTEVVSIDITEKGIKTIYRKGTKYLSLISKNVLVATGRSGFFWWRKELRKLNIKYTTPVSSIGLRFELPKELLSKLGRQHPDLKIRIWDNVRKYKTFCFCAGENGGRLKYENYGKFTLLDGHILTYTDRPSTFGNFALLAQLIDDERKALEFDSIYQRYIEKYILLNGGRPTYQNYFDFKNKNSNSEKRNISVRDSVQSDVWEIFESNFHEQYCAVADKILHWIFLKAGVQSDFESFMKKVNVVALEIEGIWDKIETNSDMMSSIPNLYVAGDCAGLSQGIIQAMISGIAVAKAVNCK